MTEPRKTAIVFLIVMAIGLIVLAIEWLRMRVNGYFWLLIISLILLALALSLHPVRAQEHRGHPPEHQAIHEKFYSTWMMPDNRAVSCCHKEDCAPAESKFENGHWMARKVGAQGEFTPVPEQKIERERDSPDGRSHLCGKSYSGFVSGFQVYCFVGGNGA